jgi:5'(3')-deoxyribonucleotidase
MSKKIIAVDIDDVLAAQAESLVAFSNEQWGTNLTVDDYDEHWGAMWQIEHDLEETERRAYQYFDSGAFRQFRHHPEAKPVLKRLAKKYRLVVVTSRRRRMLKETTDWINQYFPGFFDEIHYAGIWDDTKEHRHNATKADLCKDLGVDYLIDDQLKHCLTAADQGITVLLFGNYKWNQADQIPENVTRVADWGAVERFFDGRKS